jgi:hypothetical protein
MGMRQLEAAILAELREVAKNPKLRQKDIAEWSSGAIKVQEGETLYFLPLLQINVAVAVKK